MRHLEEGDGHARRSMLVGRLRHVGDRQHGAFRLRSLCEQQTKYFCEDGTVADDACKVFLGDLVDRDEPRARPRLGSASNETAARGGR